ncbi:MAG: hypothetical protein ACHQF0_14295 [Chitinophagales bacterium]
MIYRKHTIFLAFILALEILLLISAGCKKEYSCEGCLSTKTIDSIPLPSPPLLPGDFPQCSLCHPADELQLSTWNFKTSNSFLCGVVNNAGAGIDPEKKDFTFFGPSACSIDTGLVMTVYFPVPLTRDRSNITTNKVAFYYYDHHAPKDIFIALSTAPFYLTLKSFTYATGIATGTFGGIVYRANGDTALIREGNFSIKLKY